MKTVEQKHKTTPRKKVALFYRTTDILI